MMLLSSSVSAPSSDQFDGLAGSFRRIADGARKARVEIADRHHARGGDFVLQVVRKLGEFVDVAYPRGP